MSASSVAPILDRLPYSESALDKLALNALRHQSGLLPQSPNEIPIERVIESIFDFNETYEFLDPGILGETHFGIENRPLRIRIARHLGEIGDQPAVNHERRETLAHECGHCLAHGQIYSKALAKQAAPQLPGFSPGELYYACRDSSIAPPAVKPTIQSSSHRWLEWEANYLMVSLLLPIKLVQIALSPWVRNGVFGVSPTYLPPDIRKEAVEHVSRLFNVSFALAAKRIHDIIDRSTHPDLFTTP